MYRQFLGKTGVVLVGILFLVNLNVYAGLPAEAPFTYQGQLKQSGVPVTDTCDFEFTLWNDSVGVTAVEQVGPTLTFDGTISNFAPIEIVNGLFAVELDFGSTAFTDDPRWLEIAVSCPTRSGFYSTLTPRELLTATPMSIHTRGITVDDVGNVGIGTTSPLARLQVEGTVGDTLLDVVGRSSRTLANIEGSGDTILRVNGRANTILEVSGSGRLFGNHIALFDSTNSVSADGIAIRLSNDNTNRENNFITFLNGQSIVTGRIEGFDKENGDWFTPPPILTASLSFDPGISYNEDWYTPGTLPTVDFTRGTLPTASLNPGSLPNFSFTRGSLPSLSFNGGALPSLIFNDGSFPTLTFSRGTLPSFSPRYCNALGIRYACGFNWSAGSTPSAGLNGGTLPTVNFTRGSLPTVSFTRGSLPSLSITGGALPTLSFVKGTLPLLSFSGGSLPTINKAPFILDEPTLSLQLPTIEELEALYCWSVENGTDAFLTLDPVSLAAAHLKQKVGATCKDEGVTYGSKGADYAEWLPKLNPDDRFQFAQIVGIHDGKVSLKTEGAQQIMAISRAPVVVGNVPPKAEEDNYVTVGFMGQLPVVVRGKVKPGDYIIPSGLEDGTAIAISPTSLKLEHLNRILGRSWSESENDIYNLIQVAIGLDGHEEQIVLERHQYQIREQADQIQVLTQENARLKKQMASMSGQLSTMSDSMRKIEHMVSTQSLRKGKVVSATVQP